MIRSTRSRAASGALWLSVAAAAMLGVFFAMPTAVARADDTVFLQNGGRIIGAVMEESPETGVRVRLSDGTVRQVPPENVLRVEYEADASGTTAPALHAPAPVRSTPPAPRRRYNDLGLLIAGAVMLGLGVLASITGGVLAGISDGDTLGEPSFASPILWSLGLALIIPGVIMTPIGAQREEIPVAGGAGGTLTLSGAF